MDQERFNAEVAEYINVQQQWQKLLKEGPALAQSLLTLAEFMTHLPGNLEEHFRSKQLYDTILALPSVDGLKKFVTDAEQTLKRKRELYISIRQHGLNVEW